MSIADMQHFAQLRSAEENSVPDRLGMLREHPGSLEDGIRRLRRNAKALDDKIRHDERLLSEQQERQRL